MYLSVHLGKVPAQLLYCVMHATPWPRPCTPSLWATRKGRGRREAVCGRAPVAQALGGLGWRPLSRRVFKERPLPANHRRHQSWLYNPTKPLTRRCVSGDTGMEPQVFSTFFFACQNADNLLKVTRRLANARRLQKPANKAKAWLQGTL